MLERFLASRQLYNFVLAPSNLRDKEDFDQMLLDQKEDAKIEIRQKLAQSGFSNQKLRKFLISGVDFKSERK